VQAPQIDGAAFRPGWLVQTRLYGLFIAGRIDRDGLDAALAWRTWAETVAPAVVQSWTVRVDTPLVPNDTGMLLRIRAAAKLRQAAEALGQLRIAILEAVAVKDRSWVELGRLLRVSDKTASSHAVEAIEALADWRAGRAIAPYDVSPENSSTLR
jgi:hypothetical protein